MGQGHHQGYGGFTDCTPLFPHTQVGSPDSWAGGMAGGKNSQIPHGALRLHPLQVCESAVVPLGKAPDCARLCRLLCQAVLC